MRWINKFLQNIVPNTVLYHILINKKPCRIKVRKGLAANKFFFPGTVKSLALKYFLSYYLVYIYLRKSKVYASSFAGTGIPDRFYQWYRFVKAGIITKYKVFIKYAAVGCLGTAIDLGSLYLFVGLLHLQLLFSTALSFFLAVVTTSRLTNTGPSKIKAATFGSNLSNF